MNEKQKDNLLVSIAFFIAVFFILFAAYICSGCSSIRHDSTGRDAIYALGQLESTIESLDRRVENITGRAENIEDEIGITTDLFREYVEAVRRIRFELDDYKRKTKDY